MEFRLGQLVRATDDLTKQVSALSLDIMGLRADINEIKLFRAKVIGASMLLSLVVSGAVEAVRIWVR